MSSAEPHAFSATSFRELFEDAPDALVIVDGVCTILLVNRETERLFGYDRAELLGLCDEILVPARFREHHASRRSACLVDPPSPGVCASQDLCGLTKTGVEFPAALSFRTLGSSRGPVVLISIRDIGPAVAIRASLEVANRELEAFSYSVAHDLRAPLRGISGFAKELQEVHSDKLDADGLDCVAEVVAGARKLGELIDALLSLAQVSAIDLEPMRCDLSEIVRAALAGRAAAEPERHVETVIEPGLLVDGDPRLLRILVDQLVSNAWKFTSKVAHGKIELSGALVDGATAYCLRDNGAGFALEFAKNLFAPFQRLHPGGEFPGAGIGLASAQRIVHRHGGRIWADAQVGKGAAFYFTLRPAGGRGS